MPLRFAPGNHVNSSCTMQALAPATAGVKGSSRAPLTVVAAKTADGAPLDRPLRVAVIGGGPSGACCAEALAKGGVETYLIERKMDNCKVRTI